MSSSELSEPRRSPHDGILADPFGQAAASIASIASVSPAHAPPPRLPTVARPYKLDPSRGGLGPPYAPVGLAGSSVAWEALLPFGSLQQVNTGLQLAAQGVTSKEVFVVPARGGQLRRVRSLH